jgi:hypothetical protein
MINKDPLSAIAPTNTILPMCQVRSPSRLTTTNLVDTYAYYLLHETQESADKFLESYSFETHKDYEKRIQIINNFSQYLKRLNITLFEPVRMRDTISSAKIMADLSEPIKHLDHFNDLNLVNKCLYEKGWLFEI